jgi:hypothetical protein
MIDVFVDFPGTWVVLANSNEKYIGRVVSSVEDDLDLDSELKVQPVFEYMSGLVQTENGGIGRQVLLNPYDLCTSFNTPVRFKAGNFSSYCRFDEMDPADRREYEKVVAKGVAIAFQARAEKSGLSLSATMPQQSNSNPLIYNR